MMGKVLTQRDIVRMYASGFSIKTLVDMAAADNKKKGGGLKEAHHIIEKALYEDWMHDVRKGRKIKP